MQCEGKRQSVEQNDCVNAKLKYSEENAETGPRCSLLDRRVTNNI